MKRCVVVGGGLAGLAAALRLSTRTDISLTLLEAAPSFGGRVRSFTDRASGEEIDNGQHVLMGACRAAMEYLADCGQGEALLRLRGMALPFVLPDGMRGILRAGRLPHPLSMVQAFLRYRLLPLDARLRILRVAARLRSLAPGVPGDLDRHLVVDWLRDLGQREGEIERFWRPVVLATMNSDLAQASAGLFAALLREIFLTRPDAADMLLPREGLSRIFVEPAVEVLRSRGALVRSGCGVDAVRLRRDSHGDAVTGVSTGDEQYDADHVILAVPPWAVGRLQIEREDAAAGVSTRQPFAHEVLPTLDLAAFVPSEILSIHVWLRRDAGRALMTGLLESTLQWVFYKGETADGLFHYSCTVSSARGDETANVAELRALLQRELSLLGTPFADDDIVRVLPIREKRATFVPAPGLDSLRPACETPVRGLCLAGDWTATGLPATIEGAVRSGFTAADSIRNYE